MFPVRMSLLGLLTITVAACASVDPATAPSPDAGTPQPIADHDWFSEEEDGVAHLTYGRDESDDVWVSLSCPAASGRVRIDQYVAPEETSTISLESGGETESWPATKEPDELNDGVYLTGAGRADAPVFQRFRRLGWLAAYGDGWRVPMVAHSGSMDGIERFFTACS
jgi:hypothetical protein